MRRTVAIAALTLALIPFGGTAQADDKALCKNGGYAGYVNPATSQPFTSQGQCVSFAAKGGTLVPVEEEPEGPAPFVYSIVLGHEGTDCTYQVQGTGEPGTVHTTHHETVYGAWITNPYPTAVDADGVFRGPVYAWRVGETFVLVVDEDENTLTCEAVSR